MSIKAMTWAWAQRVSGPTDRLVLLALADWCNDTHQAWPEQASLAEAALCSVDTVARALVRLETSGLITRRKRGKQGGGRTSDIYTLAVSGCRQPAPPDPPLNRTLRVNVKPHSCAGIKHRTAVREEPSTRLSKIVSTFTAEQEAEPPKEQFDKNDLNDVRRAAPTEIDAKTMARAEGLGLPVADLATWARTARHPTAYFRQLCAAHLATQLPGVSARLVEGAMTGSPAAFGTLSRMLVDGSCS